MRIVTGTCVAIIAWLVTVSPAHACSVSASRVLQPSELVVTADVIVVAVAREFTPMPQGPWARRFGVVLPESAEGMFRFRVVETLKGNIAAGTVLPIPGRLSTRNDFNYAAVTSGEPRPEAGYGECFAYTHRLNARYLLLLKDTGNGEWTPFWSSLGRVNDQIRPGMDPWLEWVRKEVARPRKNP
jgi:hypothetical protein